MERPNTINDIISRYDNSLAGTVDMIYLDVMDWADGTFLLSVAVEPLDGGIFPPCVSLYKDSFEDENTCVNKYYELKETIESRLNKKFCEHVYE